MPAGKPGPGVKDDETYEALRREGNSKEKSARIANASAAEGSKKVAERGGRSGSYDDWTVKDLQKRASELGIDGRSRMTKAQLIEALRHH